MDGLCPTDGVTGADDRSDGWEPAPVPARYRPSRRMAAAAAVALVVGLRVLYGVAVQVVEAIAVALEVFAGWVEAVAPWLLAAEVLVLVAIAVYRRNRIGPASLRMSISERVVPLEVPGSGASPALEPGTDRSAAQRQGAPHRLRVRARP